MSTTAGILQMECPLVTVASKLSAILASCLPDTAMLRPLQC